MEPRLVIPGRAQSLLLGQRLVSDLICTTQPRLSTIDKVCSLSQLDFEALIRYLIGGALRAPSFHELVSYLKRECLHCDRAVLLTASRLGLAEDLKRLCLELEPQDGLHTYNACLEVAACNDQPQVVEVLLDYISRQFQQCAASTEASILQAVRLQEKDFLLGFRVGPLELRQQVWQVGQTL